MKKMKENQEKIINDLVYYEGLKIVQNKSYFNFSLDSVLLPNFVEITPNTKNILDICTGNAPIPLILSTKTKAKIIGVEIQKEIFELAEESVKINNIKNVDLLNMDAKKLVEKYDTDTFDMITCNPPYFEYSKDSKINNNDVKSIARHEIYLKLEDVIKISKKLLKNGGSLNIVHRTDRFIEIIDLLKKNNLEPKRIRFVYPKKDYESNLVLIDARKNARKGLKLLPPLFVHNEDGLYTDEVIRMFGNGNDTKKL